MTVRRPVGQAGRPRNRRVSVAADDLRAGWRGDPVRCPLALALARDLGRTVISVGYFGILIEGEWMYSTSPALMRWLWRLDDGDQVEAVVVTFGVDGLARLE